MKPLQVEYRPVSALVPYAKNSRKHSEKQIGQLAASIREFGFCAPVLVDGDSGVIAGHGRVMAAKQAGLVEVPVIELAHLTPAQRRAYVVADNKLAQGSSWDDGLLAEELRELKIGGFDLGLTGFDVAEIDKILFVQPAARGDENEVPEARAEVVSRPGDVWQLGAHRLMCGDSTDAAAVAALLAGGRPHLMVTDPPYGVEYDANWRNERDRADGRAIGGRAIGAVENDGTADWTAAWRLFPGEVAYVWHAGSFSPVVADSLAACGFEIRALIIWAKSQLVIGRGHYHHQHEPCWYMVKKGGTGHWQGDRKQTTLWAIEKPRKSETGHSTQKPVECMKRPIENNSAIGDAIYEPFSGSGTTLIAAEQTGRRCYAMEVAPKYVDVAVRRWQLYTGKKAVRERDGVEFDHAGTQTDADRA